MFQMVTHEEAEGDSSYDSENANDPDEESTPLMTGGGSKQLHSET